tara:strand:+ start:74 stop:475 length:402 start_codon:yes stop_codon:yes gene_type:complete
VETEDIIQEILIQLWRSHKSFNKRSSIETWVYKVALNTAISCFRKYSRHQKVEILQDQQRLVDEIATKGGFSQNQLLNSFINNLSDTDAYVFMMYLDGLSTTDIASVVGATTGAVNTRIGRIKKFYEDSYIGD